MSRKIIDLTDQKFGRLTVLERTKNQGIQPTWLCQCECGNQIVTQAGNLKNGNTKSCGCLKKETGKKIGKQNIKHGHTLNGIRSKTYITWYNMIQRCTNLNHRSYKHYGGRGIKVCEAWLSFESFFQDMGERPPNMSIDRIDNDGDYCSENCKWSTPKEQARNMTTNRLITIDDITKCLAEWCYQYNLSRDTVDERMRRGWTPEEALELKPKKKWSRKK